MVVDTGLGVAALKAESLKESDGILSVFGYNAGLKRCDFHIIIPFLNVIAKPFRAVAISTDF